MSAPASLSTRVLILGGVVLLAGLVVVACDPMGELASTPEDPVEVSVPDSAALSFSPMPTGASLAPPGQARQGAGIVPAGPDSAPGAKKSNTDETSPYGCYLASRPYTDSVRFHSIYLHYPRGIVRAAGGETERLIFRLRAVQEGRTDTTGVRYAHCVIPETKAARKMTLRQVVRAEEEEAVREATRQKEKRARSKGSCTLVATAWICIGNYCWADELVTICSGGAPDGNPDGGGTEPTAPYPPGSGDDPPGGTGDDDSGGGSDDTCEQLDPPPGSDCEPVDPGQDLNQTKRCPNDPLADMEIRATGCGANASIEGGRYGWTRTTEDGGEKFHPGIDLLNDVGDPVKAAEGGTVFSVGTQTNDDGEVVGYGYYVIIQTASDEFHFYTHLQNEGRIELENENGGLVTVDAGDEIGQTGTSGNSDDDCSGGPPHLHYEVRQGDSWGSAEPVNPEYHLGTEFTPQGFADYDSCDQ